MTGGNRRIDFGRAYRGYSFREIRRLLEGDNSGAVRNWLRFCCREYSRVGSTWRENHQVVELLQYLHDHKIALDFNADRKWPRGGCKTGRKYFTPPSSDDESEGCASLRNNKQVDDPARAIATLIVRSK